MLLTSFAPDTRELLTWKYPFVGGSPQVLGEGADAIYSPDGEQIAYMDRDSNIFVADAEMENARLVAVTNEQRIHWIRWSPDGRRLRYMAMGDPRVIWEVDIDDGEPNRLLPEWEQVDHCCGVWTPDGRYFVFQATRDFKTHLYAMREPDDKNPGARSDPIRITVGPLEYRRPTVAPNGKSLFAIGWQLRGETVILDPATDQLRPLTMSEDLSAEWLSYAANADRMAYVSYPEGNLWTSRTDGSARLQLTFDDFTVFEPDVSPDGQYVEFYGRHGREPDAVFVVSSTGGKPERISPADEFAYSGGFSPDGKKIVFRVRGNDAILMYDVDSKTTTELPNSNGLYSPHWSPDGRQLFVHGRDWLAIYDMASGQTRKILENRPFQNPYWGSDDSTIYVTDLIGFGMGTDLYAVDTDTGAEKFITALGNNRLVIGQSGMWVGVTPAGEPMFLRDLSIHHIYELDWLP